MISGGAMRPPLSVVASDGRVGGAPASLSGILLNSRRASVENVDLPIRSVKGAGLMRPRYCADTHPISGFLPVAIKLIVVVGEGKVTFETIPPAGVLPPAAEFGRQRSAGHTALRG